MDRIIGVTELQRKFAAIFDEVATKRIAYILTRGSRPEAAMIPYEEYVKFVKSSDGGALARFDKLCARMAVANAKCSEEEVEADLRAATREVRKKR
ncbi:MAG: type II toxin-antitoxin system Phd/YefM family antitoxin [Planctomycetes bacterium]|nr:type II toxin-antitoxin system Phd/YefM family antitoxin [Planctomycetota bacterium]